MKLQTLATLALLGYTQAAAPQGVRNAAWPLWETGTSRVTLKDNTSTANEMNAAYIGAYPMACFRSLGRAYLTQSIVVTQATSDAVATQTSTQTFYGNTSAQSGTQIARETAFAAATVQNWGCCLLAATNANCGFLNLNAGNNGYNGKIQVAWEATQTGSDGSTYASNQVKVTWDWDILTAAFNQLADGTNGVCPAFNQPVTSANTETVTVTTGMTSLEKCTFQVVSTDGKAAGVTNNTLGHSTFQFHWIEFATDTVADSGSVIAADNTPLFTGPLPSAGIALNPAVSDLSSGNLGGFLLQPTATYTWNDHADTDVFQAGYIGEVAWLPQDDTPLTTTGYNFVPSTIVTGAYAALSSEYSSYNSAVSTYNPLKDAYNTALAEETARLADPLKAAFEPAVAVPERPCAPRQPIAGWGPQIDFQSTGVTDAWTITTAQAGNRQAGLYRAVGQAKRPSTTQIDLAFTLTSTNGKDNKYHANAYGFAATSDTSTVGTTTNWANAGKVFGKLGTGKATDATQSSTRGFRSKAVSASTDKSYLTVSILPGAANDAAGSECKWDARIVDFAAASDYTAPGRPGAATDPDATGAQYLAAGVAAAAVVASLY